jgi:hypothetical protein
MKNEITHPLERYKLIADPTIRQQCIDNFDEEFYRLRLAEGNKDNGTICDAIEYGFDWEINLEDFDYWSDIFGQALNGTLPLLPEPIEDNPTLGYKTSLASSEPIEEPNLTIESIGDLRSDKMIIAELRTENEKLRECLKSTILAIDHFHNTKENGNAIMPTYYSLVERAKNLLNK